MLLSKHIDVYDKKKREFYLESKDLFLKKMKAFF